MTSTIRREEEESIFRRKLLYDGHGSGEDKRLINLMRNITKFCLADDSNDDTVKLFNLINKDLLAAMNSFEKHEKVSQMCNKSFEHLEKAIEEKSKQMELVRSKLTNLELELEFAGRLKRVESYPDCQTTEHLMQVIDKRKTLLSIKLNRIKENLKTLEEACKNLQKVLEDDEEVNKQYEFISLPEVK